MYMQIFPNPKKKKKYKIQNTRFQAFQMKDTQLVMYRFRNTSQKTL